VENICAQLEHVYLIQGFAVGSYLHWRCLDPDNSIKIIFECTKHLSVPKSNTQWPCTIFWGNWDKIQEFLAFTQRSLWHELDNEWSVRHWTVHSQQDDRLTESKFASKMPYF